MGQELKALNVEQGALRTKIHELKQVDCLDLWPICDGFVIVMDFGYVIDM